MKRIYAREEYCMDCRLCEIHCIVKHAKPKNDTRTYRAARHNMHPCLRIESSGSVSFAVHCRHCEDAPCIEACIAGAMTREPQTGAVICDQAKCVGCWSCIMVCSAGAVRVGKTGTAASKCDLCMGEETPACVLNCPNEALVYEEN